MNKIKYCLDTNIVSEILRKNEIVRKHMECAFKNDNPVFICSIVYYEIIRGFKAAGSYRRLKEFLAFHETLPHLFLDKDNYAVIEKAADIYVQLHKGNQIEDNNIYIGAIALVNDCTLVTANTRHFGRIEGLKIVNWCDN